MEQTWATGAGEPFVVRGGRKGDAGAGYLY